MVNQITTNVTPRTYPLGHVLYVLGGAHVHVKGLSGLIKLLKVYLQWRRQGHGDNLKHFTYTKKNMLGGFK